MWILPSQLSKCAPDMAALDLESKTSLASDCEPSHIVSLRGSLKPISSVRWKRDSWMQHLFGAILKPSHTNPFTDWWTSSLRVIPVSHFQPQASEQVKTIQDTFGLGLQTEFDFFGQDSASLKMSKDISRWDSPQSSAIWKNWVTKCRGEYSVRRNASMQVDAQHRTNASGSSSWPTAAARDYKGESGAGRQERKGNPADTLPNAVAQWPTPSCGECLDQGTNWETLARLDKGGRILRRIATMEIKNSWPTPQTGEAKVCMTGTQNQKMLSHAVHGQADPVNSNTHGNRQGLSEDWRTPGASDGEGGVMEMREGCAGKYKLRDHVAAEQKKQWATPQAMDGNMTNNPRKDDGQQQLPNQVNANWATPQASDHIEGARTDLDSNQKCLGRDMKQWATPIMGDSHLASTPEVAQKRIEEGKVTLSRQNPGKLNPRWVEMLMNLPLGWTCPSCPASVIKNWPRFVSGWLKLNHAQMNSDYSATESSQQQQNELF